MAERSRVRARALGPVAELEARARRASAPVPFRLDAPGFDLIAEAKLASPSEGRLAKDGDDLAEVASIACSLAESGAAALSIVTEPSAFAGNLEHLGSVASTAALPVMRKDFLVDPLQVIEARAHGASGVLVIARILNPNQLAEMVDQALSYGMFALVELFDTDDLDVASSVFDRDVLVGVNARDLQTLKVDPDRHRVMAGHLPNNLPLVAESGLTGPNDASAAVEAGYRAALVGASLIRSGNPRRAGAAMLAAGRAALAGASS